MYINSLITAVIPLHNHAEWINDAIDSVDADSYDNIEIVVVDDGSTDNPVIPSTTDKGRKVIYARNEKPKGPSAARNLGCSVANPNTFAYAFLDSDDMYINDKIKKSAEILESHEEVSVVYSDYYTLPNNSAYLYNSKEPYSYSRLLQECIINCDSLVKASYFKQVGGFDEDMRVCEDYDLWVRLGEISIISHLPSPLVIIRTGSHSSTAQVNLDIWKKNWARIREKMLERQNKYNLRSR